MYFSRSLLLHTLAQPDLDADLCKSLVSRFHFASREWRLLDQLELPERLPPTRNPLLLALRRIARRELGELRAMHRVAVLEVAARRFGLLETMLEEAACLGHQGAPPPFEEDAAFQLLFSQIPKVVLLRHRPSLADLSARAAAEGARRLAIRRVPFFFEMLAYAQHCADRGTKNPELQAFLMETGALLLEQEGLTPESCRLRTAAIAILLEYPVVDRVAEAMVDLAALTLQNNLESLEVEWLFEAAEKKLALLSPELNLPLRRRLAARRPVLA